MLEKYSSLWILDEYAAAWWIKVILDAVEKYGTLRIPPIKASRCPTFRRVHAILGLDLKPRNKFDLREWAIRPGLELRLSIAGIDPKTRNVIDTRKYQRECFRIDQLHEAKKVAKASRLTQLGPSAAYQKYLPQKRELSQELSDSPSTEIIKIGDGQPSREFVREAEAGREACSITDRSRQRKKIPSQTIRFHPEEADFGPFGVKQY